MFSVATKCSSKLVILPVKKYIVNHYKLKPAIVYVNLSEIMCSEDNDQDFKGLEKRWLTSIILSACIRGFQAHDCS